MAEILGAATTATKFFFEVNRISIDNWTFKLFYKVTTSILLAGSVVSTSKQFFGNPISCDVRDGGVNQDVLNSYCWMYSHFNIPSKFQGNCARRRFYSGNLYNTYYQWVSIYLVFQALLFYLPRVLWLSMEGGLMKFLVRNARGKIIEEAEEKRESLLTVFAEHLHNKYTRYAIIFFLCELFNLVIAIVNIFITNRFLHYDFIGYGANVWYYYGLPPEEQRLQDINPMCETFPRLAACNYTRFGPGGQPDTRNALCVLGLNMVNDKIFLVIWFWYFFLFFAGGFRCCYRVLQVSFWSVRYHLIKWKIRRYFRKNENDEHIKHYIKHCSIGDWLVLYQMSRNMNKRFFADFLSVLSKRVNPHMEDGEEHADCSLRSKEKLGPETPLKSAAAPFDLAFIDDEDTKDDKKEKKIVKKGDVLDIMA